ncbi:hypothetical protein [Aurantimonas sp. VKM B-3413]|uniref:hypothetical protein n=1 Tax=Aurantimonas sp. VKM B-3413 TaxID=2779401 RepID=UPI001E3E4ACB|nr:hypothetical protein [Aurantimonas sp. VKM B-3413]MCB8838452.1 hypothetical protein [Aurantimonas sp. VKM B-3413]
MEQVILGRKIEDFSSIFRAKVQTAEAQQLTLLIEKHSELLEIATGQGRPAVAPLLAILDEALTKALLSDDHLLKTFGHLVGAQMESREYSWDTNNRAKVRWPFDDKTSVCQIYDPRS